MSAEIRIGKKNKGPKKVPKNENNSSEKTDKKPFDKKKWRERKYSKKFQMEKWEEKRKKAVLRKYYKELKKENVTRPQIQPTRPEDDSDNELTERKQKKINSFKAAQLEFERLQEEKRNEKMEKLKRKEEIKAALEKHKKNRLEKFKKLSKKTKKGQPLMKDRIQMLYEKLQSSAGE